MKQFHITGMGCAACSTRVENEVSKVPGVTHCAVNLLTNSMSVDGSATENEIIDAVVKAGYGASIIASESANEEALLEGDELPGIKRRLIISVCLTCLIMLTQVGILSNVAGQYLIPLQAVLAAAVIAINYKFFTSGFASVIHGAPNMDTLVALGASVSYLFSIYNAFTGAGGHLYFDTSAMILTLITVGKYLESLSKGRTTTALRALIDLAPKFATLRREDGDVAVAVADVKVGDIFVVKPGEAVPVDGIVEEGISAIDESALTGESIPVDKGPGDEVSAATINTSGHLVCAATRVGSETTLSQIIKMVSDAAASKAPIAKVADKVAGIFVPVVIGLALLTTIIWLISGLEVDAAATRGIAVLVISCPCALGLATPVAIMVGSGIGAKRGILFKTSEAIELTGRIETVALDKTGTITSGTPEVTDVIPAKGVTDYDLLQLALSLESMSEHPLGKAVTGYASSNHVRSKKIENFSVLPGNGLLGLMDEEPVCGGNLSYIKTQVDVEYDMIEAAKHLSEAGKTPLFFARGTQLLGIIAVADTIKDDSIEAIRQLRDMNIEVVMVTGDNRRTADAISAEIGVDEVIADVLPDVKAEVIERLRMKASSKTAKTGKKKSGLVAMVGDGINDALALTCADVGIAIGAGTDIAMDAADIVLMNSSLMDVVRAIKLSRATLRNIHQNLFWAFAYNVLLIPLAAGVMIPFTGWQLNPMIAAACMSISSLFVVGNALRLNLLNIE